MAKQLANNAVNSNSIGSVIGSGSQWISAAALAEQRRVFTLHGAEIVDGKFGETIEFEITLGGDFDTPEEAEKKVSMAVNLVRMTVYDALKEGRIFENVMVKEVLTSKGQKAFTFVDYTPEEQTKDTPF